VKEHCINSDTKGPPVHEWVLFEADVKGAEFLRFYVNGELAFNMAAPELDTDDKDAQLIIRESLSLSSGYIALQSESHPVEFRNIYVLNRSVK
jgi:hypothetical protein